VREAAVVLAGAIAFDVLLGEPPARLHPVVWIGKLQSTLRRFAAPAWSPAPAFCFGLLMAIAGPLVFGGGSWWALSALAGFAWPLRLAVAIYLLKSAFAARALAAAGNAVRRPLEGNDLPAARAARSRARRSNPSPRTRRTRWWRRSSITWSAASRRRSPIAPSTRWTR
jgi:adenosylcobinamide-phosphate synthase